MKLLSVKDFAKFRLLHKPGVLSSKLDIWRVRCEIENLLADFLLQFIGFLFLNLTMLEHLINIMVFMDQKVMLGTPVLDGFADFRERVLDVRGHEALAVHDLLL